MTTQCECCCTIVLNLFISAIDKCSAFCCSKACSTLQCHCYAALALAVVGLHRAASDRNTFIKT